MVIPTIKEVIVEKKLVSLTDGQKEYLEKEAERLGLSSSEVLRRIVSAHQETRRGGDISALMQNTEFHGIEVYRVPVTMGSEAPVVRGILVPTTSGMAFHEGSMKEEAPQTHAQNTEAFRKLHVGDIDGNFDAALHAFAIIYEGRQMCGQTDVEHMTRSLPSFQAKEPLYAHQLNYLVDVLRFILKGVCSEKAP